MTRMTMCAAAAGGLWLAGSVMAAELSIQVLDRDGKPLPDAVVILESSATGARPQPKMEHTIEQEGMRFVPALSVVHLATKVNFVNLDRWDHHVRGGVVGPGGVYLDPSQGYAFRLAGKTPGKSPAREQRQYSQTGPQLLGCHLHASMRGHLYVTDSPWAAVSDAQGQLRLSGVPAGSGRLRVWHADELVETPAMAIQVLEGMAPVRMATQVAPLKKRAPAGPSYGY